jgi:small redox-active disulfide protein 2
MQITILGPGCRNCTTLEKNARAALATTGIDAEIVKITDYAQIAAHGVMSTPGLAIDGTVLVTGRVPDAAEVATLIRERA